LSSKQEDFFLYIPAGSRDLWARFRERVENEGKPVSDVIMELVKGYLGEEE
jgi:hypothetical protein